MLNPIVAIEKVLHQATLSVSGKSIYVNEEECL